MSTEHDLIELMKEAAKGLPAPRLAVLMTRPGKDYRTSRGDSALSKAFLCAEYAKHVAHYPVTFIEKVRAEAQKEREAKKAKQKHLTAALAECNEAKTHQGAELPIQIGKTYELTKTVVNPFYDRRVKGDWRYDSAQWAAHTQFRALDDLLVGKPCLTIVDANQFVSTKSVYGQLLVPHLIIVDTFESFMFEIRAKYGSDARSFSILEHMVSKGQVTREQIEETIKSMKGDASDAE